MGNETIPGGDEVGIGNKLEFVDKGGGGYSHDRKSQRSEKSVSRWEEREELTRI